MADPDNNSPPDATTSTTRRWWLRRWLNRMELDRATFYVVATRVWRLLAGPLTAVLISLNFSPEVQGFYVSFWFMLSLQALVDLGISGVILQSATHEWAHLCLDRGEVAGPSGHRRQLAALDTFFRGWFRRASIAFALAMAPIGWCFFSDGSEAANTVAWTAPWIVLTMVTGASLALTPRIAILEGCGQIAAVNRMRLAQMICGNLGVWAAIAAGLNLWVAVVAASIQWLGEVTLLLQFRRFFQSLPAPPADARPRDWNELVRPMQRRLGVQTGVKFFANNLLTLVVHRYHGAAASGPVGLTWNLLNAVQQAAFAWVHTRRPLFGQYVAQRNWSKLNAVFRRLTIIAALLAVAGVLVAVGIVAVLPHIDHKIARVLASRLLGAPETAIIGAMLVANLLASSYGVYLGAHRRAPMVWVAASCDLLTAALVWWLGSRYGVLPAAIGMLAVSTVLRLPGTIWIWRRCRTAWHSEP
ncbi:MAG: hypothetical protein KDB14_25635 [Planctomycetales bacterium]|nr:hypothetical protein [Planctomycetales bacterium]